VIGPPAVLGVLLAAAAALLAAGPAQRRLTELRQGAARSREPSPAARAVPPGPAGVRPPARQGLARRLPHRPRGGSRGVEELPDGLIVDLVAAAVDAGAAPPAACRAVAEALRLTDAAPGRRPADGGPPPSGGEGASLAGDLDRMASGLPPQAVGLLPMYDVIVRAARTGIAPAVLLRALAEEQRRAAEAHCEAATNRLPVLLVLPAGLCLLPAALLLGVVPMILDLLRDVLG